jgi:hypothetical protein
VRIVQAGLDYGRHIVIILAYLNLLMRHLAFHQYPGYYKKSQPYPRQTKDVD